MDAQENDEYYDSIAPSYDDLHGAEQDRKLVQLLSVSPVPPGSRVIDVGCGTGRSIASLRGCVWHGVEPSAGLIAHAHPDAKGRIVKGMAESIPFPDGSADAVLCLTVLQNVRDLEKALAEIARVCTPGGRILLSVLKKSERSAMIDERIRAALTVLDAWEEQQDHCYVCRPR